MTETVMINMIISIDNFMKTALKFLLKVPEHLEFSAERLQSTNQQAIVHYSSRNRILRLTLSFQNSNKRLRSTADPGPGIFCHMPVSVLLLLYIVAVGSREVRRIMHAFIRLLTSGRLQPRTLLSSHAPFLVN
jgi:hypothetical protein